MTNNRIEEIDKLFHEITDRLPMIYDSEVDDEFKETHFLTNPDGTQILSTDENETEAIANLFDQLYGIGTCQTGYYDSEDEFVKIFGEDAYVGLYYISIGQRSIKTLNHRQYDL